MSDGCVAALADRGDLLAIERKADGFADIDLVEGRLGEVEEQDERIARREVVVIVCGVALDKGLVDVWRVQAIPVRLARVHRRLGGGVAIERGIADLWHDRLARLPE